MYSDGFPLTNEPFREDDGTGNFADLNPMTAYRTGNPFNRQDSLQLVSELQEKDKERNHNFFMEADVNIENYLKELRDEEDDDSTEDPELAKTAFTMEQSAVYESVHNQHGADEYDDFMDHLHEPPLPHATLPVKVKSEISWDDEPSTSTAAPRAARTPVSRRPQEGYLENKSFLISPSIAATAPQQASRPPQRKTPTPATTGTNANYVPQTKARKYQLKPREEKENPQYKLKRMRNNDAVRRSRQKAKEQQEAREKELKDLRDRISEKEHLIQLKDAELQTFKSRCKCGAMSKV